MVGLQGPKRGLLGPFWSWINAGMDISAYFEVIGIPMYNLIIQ